MPKKRPNQDTTLPLAPLTVDEALSALLKTPPPADVKGTRKQLPKAKRKKGR